MGAEEEAPLWVGELVPRGSERAGACLSQLFLRKVDLLMSACACVCERGVVWCVVCYVWSVCMWCVPVSVEKTLNMGPPKPHTEKRTMLLSQSFQAS